MARLLAVLLFGVLLGLSSGTALAQTYPHCPPGHAPQFQFGFAALKDTLGEIMGEPLECEHPENVSGDTLQATTTGLAFYRKSTNTPTFTDGWRHWALTERGLIYWEGTSIDPPAPSLPPVAPPPVPPPSAPAYEPVATLAEGGWARVVEAFSPEALLVQNEIGEEFAVWHVGVIGPAQDQGDWHARATDVHRGLLPIDTMVWLQRQEGLTDPGGVVVYRHVIHEREMRSESYRNTIGAQLLRAGATWVFPHSDHGLILDYASLQADAVVAQAGFWAESGSSDVFRPAGQSHGGFPTNPLLLPALHALDANDLGHSVLAFVNFFPVEIGVSEQRSVDIIGSFQSRYYTIQLSPDVLSAAPESIAALLMHELTHASQFIEMVAYGKEQDCYAMEVEAFESQSLYWLSVHGPDGKLQLTHWLDLFLNDTLWRFGNDLLDIGVYHNYEDQCAVA